MPAKTCEVCGTPFDALSYRTTTCSDRCRMRLTRAGGSRIAPPVSSASTDRKVSKLARAVLDELEAAGRSIDDPDVDRCVELADRWASMHADDLEARGELYDLVHALGLTGAEPDFEPASVVDRSRARVGRKQLRPVLTYPPTATPNERSER